MRPRLGDAGCRGAGDRLRALCRAGPRPSATIRRPAGDSSPSLQPERGDSHASKHRLVRGGTRSDGLVSRTERCRVARAALLARGGDRLDSTFSLVFLTNASSNAVVTVAGVHVRVGGPKDPLPVSGAAFRDDDRNSIKMILTIAAPAATGHRSPAGPSSSNRPPVRRRVQIERPTLLDQTWTLVPCSSIN